MELIKNVTGLQAKEQLLKARQEDRAEELNTLADRMMYLQQEEVLESQELNLIQLELEDSKR